MFIPQKIKGIYCTLILFIFLLSNSHGNIVSDILQNGDFELKKGTAAEHWTLGYKVTSQDAFYDKTDKHKGDFSFCIQASNTIKAVYQRLENIERNSVYEVTWWGKTDGKIKGKVHIRHHPDKNKIYEKGKVRDIKTAVISSTSWQKYKIRFKTPNDNSFVSIIISGRGEGVKGKVWYDDISIKKIYNAAVSEKHNDGNLLKNGDFEFGYAGWTDQFGMISKRWKFDYEDYKSGRRSIQLKHNDQIEYLVSYPVPIKKGQTYLVSFFSKGNVDGEKVRIEVLGSGLINSLDFTMRKQKKDIFLKRDITLGKKWIKHNFIVQIPPNNIYSHAFVRISKDYKIKLGEESESSKFILWLDDFYFGKGSKRQEKRVDENIGIEFKCNKFGNTFFYKSESDSYINFKIIDFREKYSDITCQYNIKNIYNETIFESKIALKAKANKIKDTWQKLKIDTSTKGSFELEFKLYDCKNKFSKSYKLKYAVINPLITNKCDETSYFGMVTWMFNYSTDIDGNMLKLLSLCGVRWIRDWMSWNYIEPQRGEFKWAWYDKIVNMLKKNNMSVLISLYRCWHNNWQGETGVSYPHDINEWNNFVKKAAIRYKNEVKYWEVWNEPGYKRKFKTPEQYLNLLKNTYKTLKEVNPQIKVVGYSFAHKKYEWIDKLISKGIKYVDIISYHSYNRIMEFYNNDSPLVRILKKEDLVNKYPIWNTEWGIPSENIRCLGSPELDACEKLAKTMIRCKSAGVAKYFWFVAENGALSNYSVFYDYFVPRPRLIAYNNLAALIDHAEFKGKLIIKNNLECHLYSKNNTLICALWFNEPLEFKLAHSDLKDVFGAKTKLLGLFGNEKKETVISTEPRYIIVKDTTVEGLKKQLGNFMNRKTAVSNEKKAYFGKIEVKNTDLGMLNYSPSTKKINLSKDGFIKDWIITGPFVNPYRKGFNHNYFDKILGKDANIVIPIDLDLDYSFSGIEKHNASKQTIKIQPVKVHLTGNTLNFQTYFNKVHALAYASCWIYSEKQQKVKLKIGSDDGLKLWLNHQKIGENFVVRAAEVDNDTYLCTLKKGDNYLLVKVEQNVGAWSLIVRITDMADRPLKNVKLKL